MKNFGIMIVAVILLSGCSSLGIEWPSNNSSANDDGLKALSMAQQENSRLKTEEQGLRQTLKEKKAELAILRAAAAQ